MTISDDNGAERLTHSVVEAAGVLGIGKDLAYSLVRTGQLRTVPLGRRIIVPRHTVDELLSRQGAQALVPYRQGR